MKAKIKVSADKLFRNKDAKSLYAKMSTQLRIIDFGQDSKGCIYFHFVNGNTDRYTRREFLALVSKITKNK